VPRALIVGIAGTRVGANEFTFIREADPLGFILFARNVAAREQVIALVEELRGAVGRADAPVLIDQEGGRVARLRPPQWRAAPAAAAFGALARLNRNHGLRAATLNAQLIGAELAALGITVDCAPVADVPVAEADPIIGDRAFDTAPEAVAALAGAFCDGLDAAGVLPVIKHIPGHGRAAVDSHKDLPRVTASRADLSAQDFVPFRALARRTGPQPWAMTAHVVYECCDKDAPATLSHTVITDVIRGDIGFDGVIISDDLSMDALTGPYDARAGHALSAGCDLVLHCNGRIEEMTGVAAGCGPVGAETVLRLERSLGALRPSAAFDVAAGVAELDALMATVRGAA
jgi:beta-N-acetylhexosaminidase